MPQLVGFCLAIILSQFQAQLLSPGALAMVIGLIALSIYWGKKHRFTFLLFAVMGFLIGLIYSNVSAHWRINQVLNAEYELQDVPLLIEIKGVPVQRDTHKRTQAFVLDGPFTATEHIQLNWYGAEQPAACEVWQITARLKRPHGLRNPGSWSYRQYLLEQNIQAVGYVKTAHRISQHKHCFAGFREGWHSYVASQFEREDAAWLIALSTGDKALLSSAQYKLMQATGINHLFVISGLHIGLTAMVVYGAVLMLRRLGLGILLPGDWRPAAALLGLLAAFAYTALADFVIPAQRSMIMLVVFFAGQLVGIHLAVWFRYWLAMALVLLINPFSAMNIGFSLSFAAVALLIIALGHLPKGLTRLRRIRLMVATQFYIALGLSPLLLLFFQQMSLSGPWINLFAIPWVSLIVTPIILLALLGFAILGDDLGLLDGANSCLKALFWLIDLVHGRIAMVWQEPQWSLDSTSLGLLALLCAFLWLPRNLPAKYVLAGVLLLTFAVSQARFDVRKAEVAIHVLDVGQGLAVLVRTEHHSLLYDTGAAWQQSSMAEQVIKPVLAYYRIRQLDKLVISHFDNDHAGGAPFLLAHVPIKKTLAQVMPQQLLPANSFTPCQQGLNWQWDGVAFEFLHPKADFTGDKNQSSCVLLISAQGRQILLPGDIGRAEELNVLAQLKEAQKLDVLVAPHHGSRSSSSFALVEKLADGAVIFPVGYRNSYGHPHPLVQKRYREVGAQMYSTAVHGMVTAEILQDGTVKVSAFRNQAPRYWDPLAGNHLEY